MIRSLTTAAFLACSTNSALAIDAEHDTKGREIAMRAIEFLRAQQDRTTGGWAHNPDGPNFPAISGLVLNGMLLDPAIDTRDESVRRGLDYMLSFQQPDGGIYDQVLPNYNTSLCLSALALVHDERAGRAVSRGQTFIRGLQYHGADTASAEAPDFNEPVPESHPYYGGVGYGSHGRPDLSNLGFFLQALHDTGVSSEDPAFQRAMTFLARTQMLDEANDQPYADGSNQGGFIYATVPERESIDGFPGQSQAGEFEETLSDGTTATRLRAYGSMTYVGFKSLIYANLRRDDPRVVGAMRWIEENYSLAENPGLGEQGLYYQYLALARALDAWGEDHIDTPDGPIDWREDLIDRLAELQQEDGGFEVRHERWMEGDRTLITAYALISVQIALGSN